LRVGHKQAKRIFRKLLIEVHGSSHHIVGFVSIDDVRVLPVHFPAGRVELSDVEAHRFRRLFHLGLDEFRLLHDCPMSRQDYIELLIERVPFDDNT
jgi:hypothetical protein